MTAARLTRSGRSRFLIGFGILILMFGFIAIFHSSQTQLDESRQQRLRCEQQQDSLNARMQAIIEHKFRLERSLEAERKEHLETRQNLEQKAKEQNDQHTKAKLESDLHYDSLHQRYKLLQKEHSDLVEDCSKSKKSQLEVVNSLESKVKSLQSQLQQMRSLNDKDLEELKAKYDTIAQEKDRLEILLKSTALSAEKHKIEISSLKDTIKEYVNNCDYKPKVENEKVHDQPLSAPLIGNQQQLPNHPLDKPLVQKSFNEQQLIIPKPLASDEDKNRPAAAESVQQVPPLNSTVKTSTSSSSLGNGGLADVGNHDGNRHALSLANQASTPTLNKAKRSSTAREDFGAPPPMPHKPPKQIPFGVAPIPANFEDLLNNNQNDEQDGERLGNAVHPGEADNKQDADNNRYSNVVNELIGKNNEGEQDTGAHEIKDPDLKVDKNDENLNNGAEEDNNFFDNKVGLKDNNEDHGDGEDIEVFGMAGHKHNHKGGEDDLAAAANGLLDGDNLNNEVAGDQGKEQFIDGLHLDEGNEEEEDEDDYSNPAARQEGPAIRN